MPPRSSLVFVWALGVAACAPSGGEPAVDVAAARDLAVVEPAVDLGAVVDQAIGSDQSPEVGVDAAPVASSCDGGSSDAGACLARVSGRVVGPAGAARPNLVVSLCAELCFFGRTGSDGAFVIEPFTVLPLERYAVLIHARPLGTTYYAPLPPAVGETITYPAPLPVLELPTGGPVIADDGTARTLVSGDVTLTIPAGAGVQLDPEDILSAGGDPGEIRFRAARVDPPAQMPFVNRRDPPLALYALAPYEVVFTLPVRLGFVNRTGLAAGAAVDVYVQRGLVADGAPGGPLVPAATARVSADGQRVELDARAGLRALTWVALREAGR